MEFLEFSELWFLVIALIITFITGSLIERRHFRSLRKRESEILMLPTLSRQKVNDPERFTEAHMIVGSCVVAADFFKSHLAGLRNLFGGQMSAYESLIDRARREAILRMKDQAKGAIEISCFRIVTSNIGPGIVEAIAYGTALYSSPSKLAAPKE